MIWKGAAYCKEKRAYENMGDNKTVTRKILLVEDSEPDAVYVSREIAESLPNAELTIVSTLGDAYEAYKTDFFHVVLLDLHLPDGYGAATVQEMRRFNKTVPIVALTGHVNERVVQATLQNGANYVLNKSSLGSEEFVQTIEKILPES